MNAVDRMIGFLTMRYAFRYNTVMNCTEFRHTGTTEAHFEPLDPRTRRRIILEVQREGIEVSQNDVNNYIESDYVRAFDPVGDYLASCEGAWDGHDHIGDLAGTVPTDAPLWREWFTTWLLAMVAQWQNAPSRLYGNSVAPLLISPQGYNKSTFCRQLLPDALRWGYTDSLAISDRRQVMLAMSQQLLINLDEFNQISPRVYEPSISQHCVSQLQMAVVGMVMGYCMVNVGLPIPVAVIIGIALGVAFGAINGVVAIKLHIAPIIVTLAMMLVLQGVAYLITGGYPITGMPKAFLTVGQGYVGPVPIPVILFVIFIVFGWIVMNKTYLGRNIYALGGNKEAARLAGINVNKLTVLVYSFAGFAASIAAIIMVARTNASQPGAGSSYAFDCMTAACLGGVSIAGGEGKISGTVVGVIILGILDNGLVLMGVNSNFQSVIKGLILLLAVAIDCYQGGQKRKKA